MERRWFEMGKAETLYEKLDPITLSVINNHFTAIAEEMSIVLKKTAYSPNIKDRKDFSCAIFTGTGELIAQAENIPVHLGSMALSVQEALKETEELHPGDILISNSPLRGGTHLPDITLIKPVYETENEEEPLFFVANRAHHADVGGITAGSMPAFSREIFQEGIIIPPIKIVRKGFEQKDIMKLILENVRTPDERKGDLRAQIATLNRGEKRLLHLIQNYKTDFLTTAAKKLMDLAETEMRRVLSPIPEKHVTFTDYLESNGIEEKDVPIHVEIWREDDKIKVSFEGSAPQQEGNCNAPFAVTLSATFYCFRTLLDPKFPTNQGSFRPLQVIAPKGSVVNPVWPAATSSGNVETSQRIVDVIYGALSQVFDFIPAASQGTMNNITIGGYDSIRKRFFTYYETIGGGVGASKAGNGANGVHSHMTNTLNTPIERLETYYPFRILEYSLIPNSGGKGIYNGGNGIRRTYLILTKAKLSIQSERRIHAPWGLNGGQPGRKGYNFLKRRGKLVQLKGRDEIDLQNGDIVIIETPGGGGWGKPH